MYAFIQGTVEDIEQDRVSINCGGVGYEILTTNTAIGKCAVGQAAKFYTYLAVREDALTLYGFLQKDEKEMFLRLIGVSGVGPKVGLSILSTMSAREAAIAIVSGDDKALAKVPGIGKKTAQRLVLELKGSIENQALISHLPGANHGQRRKAGGRRHCHFNCHGLPGPGCGGSRGADQSRRWHSRGDGRFCA